MLELKQNLKLSHQLIMTPQLKQAIKILQLSRVELREFIDQQLQENPILEEKDTDLSENEKEHTAEDAYQEHLEPAKIMDKLTKEENKELDWEIPTPNDSFDYKTSKNNHENTSNYENQASRNTNLAEFLLEQLSYSGINAEEKRLAIGIVGNLNEQGFLELELDDFCKIYGCKLSQAEKILDHIQHLEPPGIAARNLQESLLLQLRSQEKTESTLFKLISKHWQLVTNKSYKSIMQVMKINKEKLRSLLVELANLNINPGAEFDTSQNQKITPDVYVFKVGKSLVVRLNEDDLPQLHLNSFYQNLASNRGEAKEYLQDKIRSAQWLLRSIQQRHRTILKVSQTIVARQSLFFEKGIEQLKPMILRDIAAELGMHESTISRVTSHKYMQSPQGIHELKFFFNSSLKVNDAEIASTSVKEKIRKLISQEDDKKPISDQKITEILHNEGIVLARRTVAKYRQQLGLFSSNQRRKTI